jgi:hypothetical protein
MAGLMFFPVMDVNKYCCLLFFLISLSGKSQQIPDSLILNLPDTILSTENTLFLVEGNLPVYFSYNPAIFDRDTTLEWSPGVYTLKDILNRISRIHKVNYTLIGNQVVFYEKGQEPGDVFPAGKEIPSPATRRIEGRILGIPGGEPLSYANVWLPSTWEGTIANTDGYFVLNLVPGSVADTVAFSCMGYRTTRLPVGQLGDTMNIIQLQASFIPIQEVVIRRIDPLHLLGEALKRISVNYSRQPVIQTAFYRETIRKDDKYVAISEAVLEVYKPGCISPSSEQARVLRGRKNQDFSQMDTLMVKLQAGLETSFLLDVIRNRPDFLQENEFYRYHYRMSDIVVIQDKSAYAIDFQQRENTDPPHYRGRIYIDLESLAFRGVEFEVDPKTISSVAKSMVLKKPRKVNVRPLSASYSVRYKEEGGLFYLSMIRAENRFRIRMAKKLFGNEFRIVSEMAVTGLETHDVSRFRFREIANPKDIFADVLGGYDPAFWGPYNYLIPEESLEDALERISRLMEKQPADPGKTGEN